MFYKWILRLVALWILKRFLRDFGLTTTTTKPKTR